MLRAWDRADVPWAEPHACLFDSFLSPSVSPPPHHPPATGISETPTILFKYVRVCEILVQGSFKGSHAFQDVMGITVKIHSRKYTSQKCTVEALVNRIKKDVIMDILSQVSLPCVAWTDAQGLEGLVIVLCGRGRTRKDWRAL